MEDIGLRDATADNVCLGSMALDRRVAGDGRWAHSSDRRPAHVTTIIGAGHNVSAIVSGNLVARGPDFVSGCIALNIMSYP